MITWWRWTMKNVSLCIQWFQKSSSSPWAWQATLTGSGAGRCFLFQPLDQFDVQHTWAIQLHGKPWETMNRNGAGMMGWYVGDISRSKSGPRFFHGLKLENEPMLGFRYWYIYILIWKMLHPQTLNSKTSALHLANLPRYYSNAFSKIQGVGKFQALAISEVDTPGW